GATFFLQKPVDRQKLSILFRTVTGGMLETRRKYTRVPLQTEVLCTVGSRIIRGMTWNLSHGGMQVEVGGLQPKNSVRLSFLIPVTRVSIEASGTVVWVKENRQGIQFTNLSIQNEQSLRKFIAEVEQ
ncbi:MAG: PilZ domain-containing protein, partial [Candidatus Sulfotelmatobacter sp.]